MKRARREDGQALIEAALVIPLLLLIAVGIFEFGRAYQTWEILTNAAREGARIAVLPSPPSGAVEDRVRSYMQMGQLPKYTDAVITVDRNASITVNGSAVPASQITVSYPFDFGVLRPVARLISGNKTMSSPSSITATVVMRNEM